MILLRPLLPDDEAKVEIWAARIGSGSFMSRYEPRDAEALRRFIQWDGEDVGYIWIEPADGNPSEGVLGIMIGEPQLWGQGIGRRAIRLMISEASCLLPIQTVVLRVRPSNQRAYRCYLSSGFVPVARGEKVSDSGHTIDYIEMKLAVPRAEPGGTAKLSSV